MSALLPSREFCDRGTITLIAVVAGMCLLTPATCLGQINGVPPSVTSIQFHVPPFLPNALPSVTSLGPYGAGYRAGPIPSPYGVYPKPRGYGRGNRGLNRYISGAWVTPYYFSAYDAGYGYDFAAAGPYLQSAPSEQTLHIVVDLPPSRRAPSDDDTEAIASTFAPPSKQVADARPFEATTLVFRDGHQQQVTNYAIMGQTLYVFDTRTQKIGLGDLDIPATIKLNDDSGVEFHLPNPKQS
jgi:hypothetical protein